MNTASGSATNPSQIVCRCGKDHRGTDKRTCPVFIIISDLNRGIQDFMEFQQVLDFGKNGPMDHCLRKALLGEYDLMIQRFKYKEATSDQHPEWHLADEIARLRSYFEQIADGCAQDKKTLGPRPPPSVIPSTDGDLETTLGYAQSQVTNFYGTCCDIMTEFVITGADWRCDLVDQKGFVPKIDDAFKFAFEGIIGLPRTENSTVQDLTQKLYAIWKENRRLLCEFKPSYFLVAGPGPTPPGQGHDT